MGCKGEQGLQDSHTVALPLVHMFKIRSRCYLRSRWFVAY